jgi:O-antigen/teichoic acid export membrane protein
MADSLKSNTLRALTWSFIEYLGVQGIRFIVGIVLARLLFPEQFGLIGMLTLFMALAQSFIDSGFGTALIQKQEVTRTDVCSIFYFNIMVGLAAAGTLCLVAPWIAAFYNQPILTPLTRVLSLTIVINSFGAIQDNLLTKEINFKTLTKASLIASILSGIIGITLAAKGFGVWSLVIQQITSSLFWTALLWHLNPWRPALIFSFKSLKAMFGYGSRLLVSGLLGQIFSNIYLLVIGKLFSPAYLGFFTRGKSLAEIPAEMLGSITGRVTFPVFSSIQHDPARVKRGMKQALTTLVLVNFPMMVGLAVIARPLVLVLLTEKWGASIPYMQLLCLEGLLFPLNLINLNLLQALGRADLFLRLGIIRKILVVVNIAVTWRWGLLAMIYGMIVTSVISYFLNSYYTGVLIKYPIREQLRDLLPYLMVAVLMGVAVYAVGLLPFPGHYSVLLGQITVGIVIYVWLCWLFRLTAFMEIWQDGRNRIPFFRPGTAE